MPQVFANNIATVLAAAITTTGQTSISVASATGIPAVPAYGYFYATLSDAAETMWEVVKVTGVSGANLTIVRGQDGTVAQTWAAGSSFSIRPTAGALRDLQADAGRRVSVFKYLTEAQQADVLAGTTLLDLTAALQDAINDNYLGTLWLEDGYYGHTGLTIVESIQILGNSRDFKNSAPYNWGCALVNRSTTNPSLTIIPPGATLNQGITLRDFGILGAGSGTSTPNGASDVGILFQGEANTLFEHLSIVNCGSWGIKVSGSNHTDKATIALCKIGGCSGGGIEMVANAAGGKQINAMSIVDNEITTFGDGIKVWANNGVYIDHNKIQGNTGYGINISTPDTTGQVFAGLVVGENYFENNLLGNIRGVTNTTPNVTAVYGATFAKNVFTNTTAVTDILLTAGSGSASWHMWRGCRIHDNSHGGSNRKWVDLGGYHGASTILTLPAWITSTFSNCFGGLSVDPANPTTIVDNNNRTSVGPPQTSANFIGERVWDSTNLVYWQSIAAGGGFADWKPCSPLLAAAAPTKGCFVRGTRVDNSASASGATPGWMQTTASGGGSASTTRANSTPYALNVWAIWGAAPQAASVWECTTAGTSAGSAPDVTGKTVGQTIVDGTATWTMRSATTAAWTALPVLP